MTYTSVHLYVYRMKIRSWRGWEDSLSCMGYLVLPRGPLGRLKKPRVRIAGPLPVLFDILFPLRGILYGLMVYSSMAGQLGTPIANELRVNWDSKSASGLGFVQMGILRVWRWVLM